MPIRRSPSIRGAWTTIGAVGSTGADATAVSPAAVASHVSALATSAATTRYVAPVPIAVPARSQRVVIG